MAIPCKRPRVRINVLHGLDKLAVVCDVPGCGFHEPDHVVKASAEESARWHRAAHRSAVPKAWIERDVEYDVHCQPCGGHRRTFGTRADAQQWLDHHLSVEHGLAVCW